MKKKLLRRILPQTNPNHNEKDKSRNTTTSKNVSTRCKSNYITLEISNKDTPPETTTSPARNETIDYNIIEYLKIDHANIFIFKLTNIVGQREQHVQAFSQPSSSDKASTYQKVSGKSLGTIEYVVNDVTLDASNLCPPVFVKFEIFNYNVHNCLVDSGASVNVMPLSVAKIINAKWARTDAKIIQLDGSLV